MQRMKVEGRTAQDGGWIWVVSVFVMVALSSLFAVAGEEMPAPPTAPAGDQPPAVLTLSLERFKQQCQDPMKSEVQRAPRDIRLLCRNHETTWIAAAPGEVPLKAVRSVSTTVVSDKFRVGEVSKKVEAQPISGSCHRFQEVVEQYSVEVPVTCEDVIHDKTPIEDVCTHHIDDSKDKNEVAVQVQPTGRFIDTCTNLQPVQK